MGLNQSKSIKVATANYSGITNSPFQFYSEGSQQITKLEQIYKYLLSLDQKRKKQKDKMLVSNEHQKQKKQQNEADKNSALDIVKDLILSLEDLRNFDWNISNIEKSIQKGRYCPQYRADVGIQSCKFLTRKQFEDRWDQQYDKNIRYVKFNKTSDSQKEKKEKQSCKRFDFLMFKTMVEYSYQKIFESQQSKAWAGTEENQKITLNDRDQANDKNSKIRRKKARHVYEELLKKYHSKPYLKQQLKFQKIKDLIYTHDVVFLQDCSDQLINEIKSYGEFTIIEQMDGKDCYIIIRKTDNFEKLYDAKKYIDQQNKSIKQNLFRKVYFNYEQDKNQAPNYPAVCFIDDFLFMSVHLSSKPKKKLKQLNRFMSHLLDIHKKYKIKIIVGGDFNFNIVHTNKQYHVQSLNEKDKDELTQAYGYLNNTIHTQFIRTFEIYPRQNFTPVQNKLSPDIQTKQINEEYILDQDSRIYTSLKKRTCLQSQSKKAQNIDKCCRDFLISNIKLQSCKIIDNGAKKTEFLPTDKHPFDHFFISAKIKKDGVPQDNKDKTKP